MAGNEEKGCIDYSPSTRLLTHLSQAYWLLLFGKAPGQAVFFVNDPQWLHALEDRWKEVVLEPLNSLCRMATLVCPCGYFMDPVRECLCTPLQIQRYRSKISGPLLDRIDIHISLPPVSLKDMRSDRVGEASRDIRIRVNKARDVQRLRYSDENGLYCNADMKSAHMNRYCKIDKKSQEILEVATGRLGLSARAYNKVLKVARTIADLDGREDILPQDISEAIGYRTLDRAVV